jgi:hypothetical protein
MEKSFAHMGTLMELSRGVKRCKEVVGIDGNIQMVCETLQRPPR